MRVDLGIIEERPEFGCVIFDDINNPTTGWASLKGGAGIQIRGVGDLRSDAIWITNLNWQQLYQNNLHKNPKVKRENFFRLEMMQLASELGIRLYEKPKESCEILSELFDRTMAFAINYYDIKVIKDSLKNTIDPCFFNQEVIDLIKLPESVKKVMEQAYLPYQRCYGRYPENAITARFRYSRSNYADNLMRFPFPIGDWEKFKGDIPKNKSNSQKGDESPVYQFLAQLCDERPALCEISVSNADPDYADLLDFGNGTEKRNWVPIQEAAHIAAFSHVNIKQILVGERYQTLSALDKYTPPHSGACGDLSASLGLLTENHWVALASTRMMQYGPTKISVTPPRAVWYRAWDRMLCMKAAVHFKRHGFHVYSYGLGGVNLAITPPRIPEALALAERLEMTTPMWIKEIEVDEDPSVGDEYFDSRKDIRMNQGEQ